MIVSWCVRWYLQTDYHICQPDVSTPSNDICDTFGDQVFGIVLFACGYFFAHQLLYFVVIQLVCMNCNDSFSKGKDKEGQDAYWTSFR